MEQDPNSIQLLFFGWTADVVGARQTDFVIREGESLASLLELLTSQYPKLADHKILTAVNEEYAGLHRKLSFGDRVAIFTAVSGG
jgi:molybdopterin converting factor small subunit